MPRRLDARSCYRVHRWSSLLCTAFLLVACLSGLPLVFSDEIADWLGEEPGYPRVEVPAKLPSLDAIVADSLRRYPGRQVSSITLDDEAPQIVVALVASTSSTPSVKDEPGKRYFLHFDARTAELLRESEPRRQKSLTFMGTMLTLHMELFSGLAGGLFMGLMGLLFAIALISGVLLYGPFMRNIDFGTVRASRSPRLRWLDLHNLLGVVTVVWALVVGLTGAMNELAVPLFSLWQKTQVQGTLQPWQGKSPPAPAELGSVQNAVDTTRLALPGMHVISVVYPGSRFGSPHHYLVWAKGSTPLTSRLFSPALVDARSGELSSVLNMPWYLRALEVSRPLHFGDYGGLPLKIIWALLDLVTIAVLGSGLYLWFARRKATEARLDKLARPY
ncbi:PepSY-associated TM helix domain-containing protein [Polaromonas sp. YR568]|uniref:PepSY-associated TM helix domain-containing protein n=1 Tax=Polaromonas sp. YR568 TaxID=1855301 RepID=UPI00398BBD67